MPYKSKAERERENWRTIPEAIVAICAADRCDESTARKLLRKALANADLGPLRWQPEKGDITLQKPRASRFAIANHGPPNGQIWITAKIRWSTGRVRDDWDTGKWLVLLIHRLRIDRYWAPPNTPSAGPASGNVIPINTRKRGPLPEVGNRIRDAMRTDIREDRLSIQALGEMTEEAMAARYHGSRDTCRKARNTILSESEFTPK